MTASLMLSTAIAFGASTEALSSYIELHEWQLREIKKRIADRMLDAKAGEPKTSK